MGSDRRDTENIENKKYKRETGESKINSNLIKWPKVMRLQSKGGSIKINNKTLIKTLKMPKK